MKTFASRLNRFCNLQSWLAGSWRFYFLFFNKISQVSNRVYIQFVLRTKIPRRIICTLDNKDFFCVYPRTIEQYLSIHHRLSRQKGEKQSEKRNEPTTTKMDERFSPFYSVLGPPWQSRKNDEKCDNNSDCREISVAHTRRRRSRQRSPKSTQKQ